MEFAFGRRPSDHRRSHLQDAITGPSAKTTNPNLNSRRACQDLHALRVPIRACVGNVRASRVRA